MYATVILNRPTHRRPPAGAEPIRDPAWRCQALSYRLPDPLAEAASVGHLVQVPLQSGTALGVIASLDPLPPRGLAPGAIRDILDILDPLPIVTPQQIDLARWVSDTCLSPLSQSLRLMLPPGLEDRTFVVVQRRPGAAERLSVEEMQLINLLDRHSGRLRLSTLLDRLPGDEPEVVLERLADRGLVESHHALIPPRVAPPRVQYVGLLADDRALDAALPRLGRASKQADVLLLLAHQFDTPITLDLLCAQAGCAPATVQALARRGWVHITARRTLLVPLPGAVEGVGAAPHRASRLEAALAALRLQPGPVEQDAFCAAEGIKPAVLRELEHRGFLRRIEEPSLALLTIPREQVVDRVIELRGGEKERALLDALRGSPGRVWVGGLYAQTGADLLALRQLAARGLVSLHGEAYDRPVPVATGALPALSPDQEAVWEQLRTGLAGSASGTEPYAALLHGVTGSGKTEIYLRAIEHVVASGRRALVLVPEISLTAQTLRRFESRFPRRVGLLHGQLSQGQRYQVWDSVRAGHVDVLVGSRAALFAPVSRLGLIVIDEAHDLSYKQDEPIRLPAYRACDVAVELARLSGAAVVFGTATPDLEMVYRAHEGTLRLLELPHRFATAAPVPGPRGPAVTGLPVIRVVDLRQELRAGNRSIFSRALRQALEHTLQAGEQAILFLNRRGSATFVLCRDCGYVARCPDCAIPLSLHRSRTPGTLEFGSQRSAVPETLVCHRCNRREPSPAECPQCGGSQVRHFGLGTERVEAGLREFLPGARVLRWDSDTASGPEHERYLQPFLDRSADVLVGTQMIAKGLDLPLVSLVGVISADTALNLPDFRAGERTFQLLTQVAGRANRTSRGAQCILQTYQPDHYAIRAAANHDYDAFYRQELAYRRRLGYPPFGRLLALRYQDADATRCQGEAQRLARWLGQEIRRLKSPIELIGPAPCFFGRVAGRFRWQIVLRAADPAVLIREVVLPPGWRIDVDPASLL